MTDDELKELLTRRGSNAFLLPPILTSQLFINFKLEK